MYHSKREKNPSGYFQHSIFIEGTGSNSPISHPSCDNIKGLRQTYKYKDNPFYQVTQLSKLQPLLRRSIREEKWERLLDTPF